MEGSSTSSMAASTEEKSLYKVPNPIRERNEGAYTPKTLSIGPYHHGTEELRVMEEYKLRYLNDFLKKHELKVEVIFKFVEEREAKVRISYAETIDMDSNKFVKMIVLDSVFLIELLTRNFTADKTKYGEDRIFGRERLIDDVCADLFLLENQLPFFILQDILNMWSKKSSEFSDKSVTQLAYDFFKKNMEEELVEVKEATAKHCVDLLATCFSLPSRAAAGYGNLVKNIPSATEQQETGVKFRQAPSKNLFDIQFNDGILAVPCLALGTQSDVLYANLIVFEQFYHDEKPINDYFYLMAQLIKSGKDADLFMKNGIIQSRLKSSSEVAKLIRDLGNIVKHQEKFYFSGLCDKLIK